MTISYNWISAYLPIKIEPERLSLILTSIGLEVESLQVFERIPGSLQGLVIGEVLSCEQHPNADKLKLTKVNTGTGESLQIVCGAANVAMGQKVVVALVGTTIYPISGDPVTLKAAKIRGIESQGMICAEDEIGLGPSHAGILVLPGDTPVGMPAADYFNPYHDWVYEIGLTPNRMDAMSHFGVARDVCAYITHHQEPVKPLSPLQETVTSANKSLQIPVTIKNIQACRRYCGLTISGVRVAESPQWLQDRLAAVGIRAINNIVDITNFVLHETGQPLHAFDADAIKGREVIIQNLPAGTAFVTLDGKERKLSADDLMICNDREPMCMAGVFGGLHSGVQDTTVNIFLESAWFDPVSVRKTSVRHDLRTEAATRFEKGVDIAQTLPALHRAAGLICEIAGGVVSSDTVDVYPAPEPRTEVALRYHYLKKLSGKNYHIDAVKRILTSLGFEILRENLDEIRLAVPYSKPDIRLPADIVEEILRIDGLDNVAIPTTITISPATDNSRLKESLRNKLADYLTGLGFTEILTNSITNSAYFSTEVLTHTVRMINNLSEELNVLRPSMLETGLEAIAYNLNRKNQHLCFFEFGKTYHTPGPGIYREAEHLCLYVTGDAVEAGWRNKRIEQDLFRLKGIAAALLETAGLTAPLLVPDSNGQPVLELVWHKQSLGVLKAVEPSSLKKFDIRQPVYMLDISFEAVLKAAETLTIRYREVNRFPVVQRDLALVVDRSLAYHAIEKTVDR
ncbi:MAG TPA: phenylalanine--tRNA ligase subunit beta, partial [Sediminibacterium sp.]|nr:phenylalanine--tRNA ligase subunit beta [Sediminibacterium sp.]